MSALTNAGQVSIFLGGELTCSDAVQVASQQGTYLAGLFNAHRIPPVGGTERLSNAAKPFKYHHSGNFAYIGGDRAVLEVAFDPGAAHSGTSAGRVPVHHKRWVARVRSA